MNTTPAAPQHLSDEARAWWDRLQAEYGVEDEAGLILLQTGLEAFDAMREAQNVIEAEGLAYRDRFQQPKAHPLLSVVRDSRAQLVQCLRNLNFDIVPTKGGE